VEEGIFLFKEGVKEILTQGWLREVMLYGCFNEKGGFKGVLNNNFREEGKMKLKKYLISGAIIFLAVAFLRGNVSAFDMAEYCPLNQGDEWIYLTNIDVIFHSGDDPISASYLQKRVINGTEEVNGVETIKLEAGPLGSPPANYICFVMDSEGLKKYRQFNPGFKVDTIFDPPAIMLPAQFDLGDVHQGTYSLTNYSTDDGSLMSTATGNNTACLKSVEDVTVRWGGNSRIV